MYDTLIFDFDGTLIDSAPGILATFAEVLSTAGISPATPLDQNLIGPPLQPTMEKLLGEQNKGSNPELLQTLIENFKLRYAITGIAHTPAYPDAERTLQALHDRGLTLYLATNKRASPTLALLEKFGWAPYFRRVYCIDSHRPVFSDKAAMLRQLLHETMLSREQCLYIGDTEGDYLSANACGVDFAAALWGYGDWEDKDETILSIQGRYMQLSDLCAALQKKPPQ